MNSCEEVINLFEPIVKLVARTILNLRRESYQENNVQPIDPDSLFTALQRHSFLQFGALCDFYRKDILQFVVDRELPRSVSRTYYFLSTCLFFFYTDLTSIVMHLCDANCRFYRVPPIAEAQGGTMIWDDSLQLNVIPEDEDVDFDSAEDDGVHVIYEVTQNFEALTIDQPSETINDPPPVYDYPPHYEISVSDTILPLYFIRYGLEIFEVFWDLLLNEPTNPDTVKYDMYDFQDVQSKRDQIMQSVSSDITTEDVIQILKTLENLFDQIQWYRCCRTEEYFRRHYPNAVDTVFAFHVSCPACHSQMLHCYKELETHQACANENLCLRSKMRSYFEPQVLIPYGPMFNILTQRKQFGIQKTFDFYAQEGDHVKFDHFLTNIENSMAHSGYNAQPSEAPVVGNDLDLTFSPQSLCKLDPIAWRLIYHKYFRPHIQDTDQDHFARFLSIALSGSLRQARLYHLCPYHLRKLLWDGRIPWVFVEPYSRNLESLMHRLTLDSIFGAFRNGHTWQLKPSMNKIYHDYNQFRESWKPMVDSEAFAFLRLLNQ
uniref:Uncharacterized protein n=1 Tax=Picornavirales sp. TaxID=1955153 RepID=A0A6M3YNY9_9VIRU|nr:MAG: hypothetical protein 2 [Picornavirales sp.]